MKLEFGNPEHIRMRDELFRDQLVEELIKKVKCPFCKAPADHWYHFDKDEKVIGWNFTCATENDKCPNSIEYCEKNGYEGAKTFTDFNGNFVDGYDDDCIGC